MNKLYNHLTINNIEVYFILVDNIWNKLSKEL